MEVQKLCKGIDSESDQLDAERKLLRSWLPKYLRSWIRARKLRSENAISTKTELAAWYKRASHAFVSTNVKEDLGTMKSDLEQRMEFCEQVELALQSKWSDAKVSFSVCFRNAFENDFE
jgi:hypothetical protein